MRLRRLIAKQLVKDYEVLLIDRWFVTFWLC